MRITEASQGETDKLISTVSKKGEICSSDPKLEGSRSPAEGEADHSAEKNYSFDITGMLYWQPAVPLESIVLVSYF